LYTSPEAVVDRFEVRAVSWPKVRQNKSNEQVCYLAEKTYLVLSNVSQNNSK